VARELRAGFRPQQTRDVLAGASAVVLARWDVLCAWNPPGAMGASSFLPPVYPFLRRSDLVFTFLAIIPCRFGTSASSPVSNRLSALSGAPTSSSSRWTPELSCFRVSRNSLPPLVCVFLLLPFSLVELIPLSAHSNGNTSTSLLTVKAFLSLRFVLSYPPSTFSS
jgi:hypothetical protein